MTWPDQDLISASVINMLRVNMGFKDGERLLVVTDVPRQVDWLEKDQANLQEMLERDILARLVADIASQAFPSSRVTFWPFPATGGHGTEPDGETAAQMRQADVVIALTTYSLSHTNARSGATESGARLASMPQFEAQMFNPGGPMAADPMEVAAGAQTLAGLLTSAAEVVVRSPCGTDLRFSIAGRSGQVDDGLYGTAPGRWGNLPAGEAFAIPLEGTGEGVLVAPAGWYPKLDDDMIFRIEKGVVVDMQGRGKVFEKFYSLLNLPVDSPLYHARRNLAELGIGTNPNARKPDNVLEAEKIKGTVHIAIGDNIHMGGQVEADLHDDFTQPQPDLILDGRVVIEKGVWKI